VSEALAEGIEIRRAAAGDEGPVRELLASVELPHEDVVEHLEHFFVALHRGDLVGVAGFELHCEVGLLRSLAVAQRWRGRGLAGRLGRAVLAEAGRRGVGELYLLTTTAEDYCRRLGFETVERTRVPGSIRKTKEFSELCPSTAVCMQRTIERKGE